MDGWMDGWMDGRTDWWLDGWVNGWVWVCRWVDGWMVGREANHSPPSSAEVKNLWRYSSIPPYIFMALCLVKHGTTLPYSIHVL
jgi:hypothetical protein